MYLSDLEHNSPFPHFPGSSQLSPGWAGIIGSLNQTSCTLLCVTQAPLGKKITPNSPGHTSPNAQQTPAWLPGLRKQSAQKAVRANAKQCRVHKGDCIKNLVLSEIISTATAGFIPRVARCSQNMWPGFLSSILSLLSGGIQLQPYLLCPALTFLLKEDPKPLVDVPMALMQNVKFFGQMTTWYMTTTTALKHPSSGR